MTGYYSWTELMFNTMINTLLQLSIVFVFLLYYVYALQMDEFQKSHVHMSDPDRVEELVTQLIQGGKSKLQVITLI